MWCTRWYLPLVLLPLPIAPPYFLILFLLSTTLHAKPCFYCIILLSAMFMSSCYWPPVTIDTPLSAPWADNITTFGDALISRIPNIPTDMIPTAIPIIDRCWCDFSGGLFEPFNTTRWEVNSVEKMARAIELRIEESARALEEASREGEDGRAETSSPAATSGAQAEPSRRTGLKPSGILGGVWPFSRTPPMVARTSAVPDSWTSNGSMSLEGPRRTEEQHHFSQTPTPPRKSLLAFRKEYDLRPYGFDMVVDLGWAR